MMPIEDQVCSLPLAKRLKELGVKQESHFYYSSDEFWRLGQTGKKVWNISVLDFKQGSNAVSAFTVAELGEELPRRVKDKGGKFYELKMSAYSDGIWVVIYTRRPEFSDPDLCWTTDVKEADSRAKMRIYLIEKGLVKP